MSVAEEEATVNIPVINQPTITISSPRTGNTIAQTYTVVGVYNTAGGKAPKFECQFFEYNDLTTPAEATQACATLDAGARVWWGQNLSTSLEGKYTLQARMLMGTPAKVVAKTHVLEVNITSRPMVAITSPVSGDRTLDAANVPVTIELVDGHTFTNVEPALISGTGVPWFGPFKSAVVQGDGSTVSKVSFPASATPGDHYRVEVTASNDNPAETVTLSVGELKLV